MSRLFLVEDHPVLRDGLRLVLGAAGHSVVGEADTPTAAVAGIAETRPDAALLDLDLGARSGHEVLAELARRRHDVPVIVLTMLAQPAHIAEALRLGARGYLLKAVPSADLLEAIDAVVGGRCWWCAEAAAVARAGPGASAPAAPLSPRERQIALMVCRGASSAAIAEALHLSPKTVDTYRSRLMAKLGLADVPALVRWAIREGWLDVAER